VSAFLPRANAAWTAVTEKPKKPKGGNTEMELFKRLIIEEEGQGLVEYTLIVLLVALVFWVAIRDTQVGSQLSASWTQIKSCLADPNSCSTGS
jgi:Flp pilus assembly pilin Flp